ncbi:MAG: fumarylacetoacetate hydrolase family protein [Phycisphaerales bacterium]|nr:MAG: fumarylacetoacetate hydrolase family protein [Phycisphaerales bacterium]
MRRVRKSFFTIVLLTAMGSLSVVAAGPLARSNDDAKAERMVAEILGAHASQTQIQYLTKTYGSFSIERAYEIQALLAEGLSKKLGSVSGYKVAYASRAAQEQFGVDEPASGPLFRLQRVPSGSKLPAGAFMEITLETEIAFTIGKRIDEPVRDVEKLKNHVKWVHAAFDVGDYRFVSGPTKPTPQDMIATGVGAHFHVLGPGVAPGEADVDSVTLKLMRNGQTLADSPAANVMGSPWNSLMWLANKLARDGGALEPGDVVVSGTAAPAYKARGRKIRGRYRGDCGDLGRVTLTIQ